jgi:predicted helicase
MVERVDRVLRSELGIADGLADERVWVLDPCCGTGSFVVEVLRRIHATLQDKGLGDLLAERLKRAACTRIVGFEIMTAPFIIAHWQVGEALRHVQAPLTTGERAAVYLTNALTGWEDDAAQPAIPGYEALVAEAGAAGAVKRDQPILVVLGNPPYNAFVRVSRGTDDQLMAPYRLGLRERWGIKRYNHNELYLRFYRVAERRIAERTGHGIVCFISSFTWLFKPSFVVMRERILAEFDSLWIDCLNGDSRETGKLAPAGSPDPSVFSTQSNREGIRTGTAIGTLVRRAR